MPFALITPIPALAQLAVQLVSPRDGPLAVDDRPGPHLRLVLLDPREAALEDVDEGPFAIADGPADSLALIDPLRAALDGSGPAILPVDSGLPASQVADEPPAAVKRMNVLLASSDFDGIGHSATGHVQVIRLANGGLRLQLKDVDIENAPDLHLYVAEEKVTGDVGKYEYIARLKGNKGNQQYELDKDFDLDRYHVVVVWCRAFDVGVAQAPLQKN